MENKKQKKHSVSIIICCLLLVLAAFCFFSARWYISVFGDVGVDAMLFTLLSDMKGVQGGLINDYIIKAALPSVLASIAAALVLFLKIRVKNKKTGKKHYAKLFPHYISVCLSIMLSVVIIGQAAFSVGIPQWIYLLMHQSTLYSEEYVATESTPVSFPKQKRNLIYIYLESMETTFLSEELGGAEPENLIPQLYKLAKENVNFSQNSDVGGAVPATGSTWTVGAMVAHSSGIPLRLPANIDGNSYAEYYKKFLPGVTSINDILHQNGYTQALMVGSDANFGGRKQYFTQHGVDRIFDLQTARDEGFIPADYKVWWGFEDQKLFSYAKQKLAEISKSDQPFCFTMLTADTHHIGGYTCPLCKNTHDDPYENVISCSDMQVSDFVNWIKDQDFYDNTTIVICGDHCTMDSGYITRRNVPASYVRRIYNCFINSAVTPVNSKNREFTTMDIFPTTLAAIGCNIEGDRLALGTNLFSGEKTLAEIMGIDGINNELTKRSKFYDKEFIQ